MSAPASCSLRLFTRAARSGLLLVGALFLALPALAQERVVTKQEFIDKLGGSEPVQESPTGKTREIPGLKLRGPAGTRPAAPKEIAILIRFKYDSTELADEFSHSQLREAGEAFSAAELQAFSFEIGGHTDGLGSEAYNLALSLRRAQAVKDLLCRGYALDCAKLRVKGYGKSQPVASNDDEAGRAQNRRVVFKRLE